MEDFALHDEVVGIANLLLNLCDFLARESRNDAVNECCANVVVLGEPLLELGIVLAEVVLPEFDVLIDALLEVVSIEEDELTRHDDKSLRLIALESLETTIEQLNELAWIAGCRSIGEFASRVEGDASLSGVGNHETNLWLVSQSEECGVLSVRIERTADAVDAGEGVHLLAIETSLEIDMVEAVLCVEPVNHTTLDRLNNNYG